MSFTADSLAQSCGPVRFESIELRRVSIAMTEPFRISSGVVSTKDAILARVQEKSGAFGWGESSSMPGGFYSSETPDSCQAELAGKIAPAVCSREFANMAALERFLLDLNASRFSTVAIESAAWEMMARRRGVSLRDLLGVPDRRIASGLAVGLQDTVGALLQTLVKWNVWDYKRVKIKIKQGHDVALVTAVREMLPGFPLFVDANADYSIRHLDVFKELDRFGMLMFEQPFAGHDLEGLAELQRHVRTPVCIDESAESAAQVKRAIEMGACRIVNIKLQRVGGFLEALRIIEVCRQHGIPVWMGTMPELGIGSAHALALASHTQFAYPTDVEPSSRWYHDDLLTPAIELTSGCIKPPTAGYSVDPEKLERYTTWRETIG